MIQRLRERAASESGFTLVELLVVMLILGILAAIAIPAFFSQRDKARDADAKADARSAQTAIETYAVDNGGVYTGADQAKLVAIEPTLSDATLTVTPGTKNYTVMVKSDTTGEFSITRAASGATSLTCGPDAYKGKGGCPSTGDWSGDLPPAP
jgi:type IV pilus assembly protein PilA